MKRIIAILLMVLFALCVVGCKDNESSDYFSKQKVIDSPNWVTNLEVNQ